jgi:hypothetical protein
MLHSLLIKPLNFALNNVALFRPWPLAGFWIERSGMLLSLKAT